MRNIIDSLPFALTLFLIFFRVILFSQVTAGSVPPGTSIYFSPVELVVIENEHDTTTYLDLDGDGEFDVRVWLMKIYPPADGSNSVFFYAIEKRYSFCAEEERPENVVYHDSGDTLCTNGSIWSSDSLYVVGCYGGWTCTHDPSPIVDKYIGYKKNETGEVGWIKVSMSLYSGVEPNAVTFEISEMLVLYLGTSIPEESNPFIFDIWPNPTYGPVSFDYPLHACDKIGISDLYGRSIPFTHTDHTIDLTKAPDGFYILTIQSPTGRSVATKIFKKSN